MKILYLLIIFILFPLSAIAGESIIDGEVEVDVTGKDAVDARTQAMEKAVTDALTDLLNKLAPPGQAANIVASLDARKIARIVRGTEVLDEKISGNRYHAQLVVSFDGDELSAIINKANENATNEQTSGISSFLIIPVYQDGNKLTLWDNDNPWQLVWKNVGLENTSGDVIVPYGDTKDATTVNQENVTTANYASLAPLTIRYGVTDIVIVQAKLSQQPDLTLTVVKKRINRGLSEINTLNYRADPQETRDLLLTRAARDIVTGLQHKKNEELSVTKSVRSGDRNQVMMLASISTMPSWTQLRSKLTSLPMVDRVETLALSAKQVDMVVYYRGSPESFARAILASNLRLIQNKDYWVVSRD